MTTLESTLICVLLLGGVLFVVFMKNQRCGTKSQSSYADLAAFCTGATGFALAIGFVYMSRHALAGVNPSEPLTDYNIQGLTKAGLVSAIAGGLVGAFLGYLVGRIGHRHGEQVRKAILKNRLSYDEQSQVAATLDDHELNGEVGKRISEGRLHQTSIDALLKKVPTSRVLAALPQRELTEDELKELARELTPDRLFAMLTGEVARLRDEAGETVSSLGSEIADRKQQRKIAAGDWKRYGRRLALLNWFPQRGEQHNEQ